jgi:transposase
MRKRINASSFVSRGDCPWRMLAQHWPPDQTVYGWFTRFRNNGTRECSRRLGYHSLGEICAFDNYLK